MNHIRQILIGTVCLLSMAASAQWQWIDKSGRKVFSDRAPPIEIPEKNILKQPGVRATPTDAATAEAASAAASAAPASAPKLSGLDKALLEKKKKAEEAQAAQRKAEEEKLLQVKAENCARAKQAKVTLDSSMRLARINEKGVRQVLNPTERAAQAQRIEAIIEANCQ